MATQVLDGELLTPSQAARRAGVAASTIIQRVKAGKLPAISTPLGRLLREADVDAYAEARRAAHAGEAA